MNIFKRLFGCKEKESVDAETLLFLRNLDTHSEKKRAIIMRARYDAEIKIMANKNILNRYSEVDDPMSRFYDPLPVGVSRHEVRKMR